MAGPLIGRAAAMAASAVAKQLAKKKVKAEVAESTAKRLAAQAAEKEANKAAAKQAAKEWTDELGSGSTGSALQNGPRYNSTPRTGRGYRDQETTSPRLSDEWTPDYKKGGVVKRPRDGVAKRGKTKGRMC